MISYSARNITILAGNERSEVAAETGIAGSVYGVAQFSGLATTPTLSDKRAYPYFSRSSASSKGQLLALRDSLKYYGEVRGPGWTDVSIITDTNGYGVELAEIMIEEAHNDINVVTYQQFLEGEENIDLELNEIAKAGTRVILCFVRYFTWDTIVLAAAEHGLVGEQYVWIGTSVLVNSELFSTLPDEALELSRGLLGMSEFYPDSEKYQNLLKRWLELDPLEYPGAGPGSHFTAFPRLGYDGFIAMGMAIDALDKQGVLDKAENEQYRIPPEVWTEAIRSVSFEGNTGWVAFNEEGDRDSIYSQNYYDPDSRSWKLSASWSQLDGFELLHDVVWFSNSTSIPDLDIREAFHYWSCHDKEEGYDPTGKQISLQTPDGDRDIDEIELHYHCDQSIDCYNISDESVDCAQNYIAAFIVFGVITGLLICVCIFLLIFVCIFGLALKYQRIRAVSPFFLIIMLLSMIVGYSSLYAWFGAPHPVSCAFQPWLLGLSSISMIAALGVKSFRVWRIFRSTLKRQKITDYELLLFWFLIMIPAISIITLWTIISTPTAALVSRGGEKHYVCTTGGFTGYPGGYIFFAILVAYGSAVLLLGVALSILTRKVPSQFNESKLLAISIYNLGFLSAVIIPVYLVVQEYNPYIAWILRSAAILYAFTATLVLQFASPFIGILFLDRCRNKKRTISLVRPSSTSHTQLDSQ